MNHVNSGLMNEGFTLTLWTKWICVFHTVQTVFFYSKTRIYKKCVHFLFLNLALHRKNVKDAGVNKPL